jgi:hypothetical protein
MNLIDKQHIICLEVGQNCSEITRTLEDWSGRLAQIDAHLIRDNMCERSLAETRRTEYQDVIERFAASPGRFDEYSHLLLNGGLADVFCQRLGANSAIERPVFGPGLGACQTIMLDAGH